MFGAAGRILQRFAVLFSGRDAGELEELGVKELLCREDWRACVESSQERPCFVLKHSTVCPISGAALQRVRQYLEAREDGDPPFYLVRVIESRPVSNLIAEETGVRHQSPQLLLLDGGKACWNASHGGITAAAINAALGNRQT